VRADVGHDQGRHRNGALPGVGFGRGEEGLTSGHLAELPGDADSLVIAVDVGALESGQLCPPQAAEAGEQDQRPAASSGRRGDSSGANRTRHGRRAVGRWCGTYVARPAERQ
jgi:hypothetical protein